ncbi:GNAT family N-acetyltransferase [Aquabacterium sp.]|uniref:GNAT family N-acetyltransferase n=1 Tax=Aquabacterium sp. TaxID=1872578 RepID=UPI002C2C8A04|nr:GNAT family N-acetyltransferase [Aquabacterium sp.]HSW04963.1 GNAT family N-acetyltransferase [Aquabacterium sp.]
MHIPTLSSKRLLLLPPSAACEALYDRFYTDADASIAYGGPLTPGGAWSRLASDLGTWFLQGFGVWVIQRREQGDLVGTCGFWQGKGWPRELTWWLLPEARGAGLAQEASLAAVAHAYGAFGWPSVDTYMNDANLPARALVQRLGGVRTGRQAFPDGLERDVFHIPPPDLDRPALSPTRARSSRQEAPRIHP